MSKKTYAVLVVIFAIRLNRFNFLTVQGIYAERLLCRLFFPDTQDFTFAPLKEMSSKKKVSV